MKSIIIASLFCVSGCVWSSVNTNGKIYKVVELEYAGGNLSSSDIAEYLTKIKCEREANRLSKEQKEQKNVVGNTLYVCEERDRL